MAAATDREREIDMRMNDKLSIGTGRDREAAPDIRTEVRTDTIRAYLKKKLRSDQILSDKIDEKYLSDAMGRRKGAAALVVFPESAAEVSFIMRSAWENELPVTPRGAGTNLTGATVPDGGIVRDRGARGFAGRFSELCGGKRIFLSPGSGREAVHNRRKYQY